MSMTQEQFEKVEAKLKTEDGKAGKRSPRSSAKATAPAAHSDATDAIAQIAEQSGRTLDNVAGYIQRKAEARDRALEQLSDALAYLNDEGAFMAELMHRTQQKMGVDLPQPVGPIVISDPYAQFEFQFNGQYFQGSAVSLLGGN